MLCKLDIEKVYDYINWNFLLLVMQKMGFGEKWGGWIRWCISIAMFSVLVKGTLSGFFHNTMGLKQGDPLSPYLVVIGIDALSSLINRTMSEGFLFGCRVKERGGDGTQITHLLSADDTLVFCEASHDHMTYLSWLLIWFEVISDLRINLDMSEILLVGKVENLEILALELGWKVGALPFTYLGLPLAALYKSVVV